ncbi:hypothetical protein B9G39_12490 [Zooshikella ganghwensis]|uniref:Uncharacterized protein n=1 Tax=Zooshikella ganghwensis TaxID=202772 RepID=A0A4V1INM0_9GAMM|nr:hypothetical protein B9G39_12490 [Zooshikella ganghwensis]
MFRSYHPWQALRQVLISKKLFLLFIFSEAWLYGASFFFWAEKNVVIKYDIVIATFTFLVVFRQNSPLFWAGHG